ncbi:hypothetical protein Ancab_025076 [Ancistrocladus abbreviatus]
MAINPSPGSPNGGDNILMTPNADCGDLQEMRCPKTVTEDLSRNWRNKGANYGLRNRQNDGHLEEVPIACLKSGDVAERQKKQRGDIKIEIKSGQQALMEVFGSYVMVRDTKDVWRWTHEKSREFSVRSADKTLGGEEIGGMDIQWKTVRMKVVPLKVSAFVWKAVKNGFSMKTNLGQRNALPNAGALTCERCGNYDEDANHVLMQCIVAYRVRTRYCSWWVK